MQLSLDYLTLKLNRLKGAEEVELNSTGLHFMLIRGGAATCRCGSAAHRLKSGDVLVVDGAAGSRLQPRDDGQLIFWYFSVESEHLFPLFSSREICFLQNMARSFRTGRLYSAASPLAKKCLLLAEEVPVQVSLDHRAYLLRIVSAILGSELGAIQSGSANNGPMRDQVVQTFDRLQTSEILGMSVGELARKFNCSRRHLNRLFHEHFGLSVAALRMEMRLLKAVSLLADPDAKIIYVAQKCGFNHLGLFNTCFKRRFGASPSQWRKAKPSPQLIQAKSANDLMTLRRSGDRLDLAANPGNISQILHSGFDGAHNDKKVAHMEKANLNCASAA